MLVCRWVPSTAHGISKSHEIKFKNHESREQKTALKDELSEPFFISYFLFSLFTAYLLTLLLIGGCVRYARLTNNGLPVFVE